MLVIVTMPGCKVSLKLAQVLDTSQEGPTDRVIDVPTVRLVRVHRAWVRPVFFHKKHIMWSKAL